MSAATPQRDPAADLGDFGPASAASDSTSATTDLGGDPSGAPPRAKTTQDDRTNREKAIQTKYDKLVNLVGSKLQGRWLQELGGDGINEALHQFETLLRDPQVAAVAKRLARNADGSWGLSAAQASAARVDADAGLGGDEFVEPWEKAIDAKLAPILERLSGLVENQQTISQANASEAVARHTRQFLTEYPLSEEERADFSERIGPAIARLNPVMVTKMTYEQFKKYVGLPEAEPYLGNVFERKRTQKRSALADLATDANGTPSLGAETRSSAPFKPKNITQLSRTLAAAAERAARESG